VTEQRSPGFDTSLACPFVAFDDDRDGRSDQPDHRHRCHAEVRPAPRAIAHQERYCLTASFGTCPTFLDWARRESARVRWPSRTAGVGGAAAAASTTSVGDDAAGGTRVEPAGTGPGTTTPAGLPATKSSSGESAGSPAVPAAAAGLAASRFLPPEETAAPSRDQRSWASPPPWAAGGAEPGPASEPEVITPEPLTHEPSIEEVAPRRAPSRHYRRVASDTPSWAPPRRYEAFPSLRPRVGRGVGAPLIGLLILIAAAAALFLLPSLFVGGDDGGAAQASPSPSVRASPSPSPSPEPSPTPLVYVIKKGDTMTKIAKAHGVTLEALLAANKDTVKDPDKVKVGQELVIPTAAQEEPSPSGEASASPSE
jgi:nucleoid-associated protein YgaU